MKGKGSLKGAVVCGMLALAGAVFAQTGSVPPTLKGGEAGNGVVAAPLYVPPLRGAPERRVGGASRGAEGSDLRFSALAPEHVGLTGEAAPTLYWYSSKVVPEAVIFAISEELAEKPLAERELPGLAKVGLQRISLAELGIQLEAGKSYEWFVTVRRGGVERSKDWVCGGALRFEPGQGVSADPVMAVRELAGSGRWYDALARLEAALAEPGLSAAGRESLLADRQRLLSEVGLGDLVPRLAADGS